MNLIATYKTPHPKAAEYTFFSSIYGIYFRRDHMLVHKTRLSKPEETEIIGSNFSTKKISY